jgi:O-6-methylguanine DNA methyltransferase
VGILSCVFRPLEPGLLPELRVLLQCDRQTPLLWIRTLQSMELPPVTFWHALDLCEEKGQELMLASVDLPLRVQKAFQALHRGQCAEVDAPYRVIATPFQRQVYKALRQLPKGSACSYAQLAKEMGQPKSARAVATALAHNPLPLVLPCHRVRRSDGQAGGYNLGLTVKQGLVAHELEKWGRQHV